MGMESGNVNDKAFGDAARMIAIETWTVRLGNIEERLLGHIDEAIERLSAPSATALAAFRAELVTRMEIAATQRQQTIEHLVEIKHQQAMDSARIAALEARRLPLTAEEIHTVMETVTRMAAVVDQLLDRAVGGP
jgi:hypothetical protein